MYKKSNKFYCIFFYNDFCLVTTKKFSLVCSRIFLRKAIFINCEYYM